MRKRMRISLGRSGIRTSVDRALRLLLFFFELGFGLSQSSSIRMYSSWELSCAGRAIEAGAAIEAGRGIGEISGC